MFTINRNLCLLDYVGFNGLIKGPRIIDIPLENDGNKNTKNSHLEKFLFGNEVMISVTPIISTLSQFSLNLMLDSGFFEVDLEQAEPFSWGKNAGCDFLSHFCRSKNLLFKFSK